MLEGTFIKSATVKVMQSYDYNHFEISLVIENEEGLTLDIIDENRKNAQRLSDKAVEQYKTMKKVVNARITQDNELNQLRIEVERIRRKDKSTWSISEKATVKALEDYDYNQNAYDYQDDYNW